MLEHDLIERLSRECRPVGVVGLPPRGGDQHAVDDLNHVNGPWRNFYVDGAKELRGGVAKLPASNTAIPDTVRAMNLD
jgi:hypothetical protein